MSLSPLASRFAIAIGAADRLVAVDAESARLAGLPPLPVATVDEWPRYAPDLVLVSPAEVDVARAAGGGARVVAFEPHDLEDLFALCRDVGAQLAGRAEALRFELAQSRPLALLAGAVNGRPRPRVVAVVDLDPVAIAGGHSYETDLIEIAGGTSVTHAGNEPRLRPGPDDWERLAPELVWISAPGGDAPSTRDALRALSGAPDVVAFAFEGQSVWLGDGLDAVRRLRALFEPLTAELERRRDRVGAVR